MNKTKLGKHGEKIAEKYLRGYKVNIIEKNYFIKGGEIDLIGIQEEDGKKNVIFFEVKLRTGNCYGDPLEAITDSKIRRIRRAAEHFILNRSFKDYDYRIDILIIIYDRDSEKYRFEWLKNQSFY